MLQLVNQSSDVYAPNRQAPSRDSLNFSSLLRLCGAFVFLGPGLLFFLKGFSSLHCGSSSQAGSPFRFHSKDLPLPAPRPAPLQLKKKIVLNSCRSADVKPPSLRTRDAKVFSGKLVLPTFRLWWWLIPTQTGHQFPGLKCY